MKIHLLERKQHIGLPLEEVFDFFGRPENLSRITPLSLGFKILTPSPVKMQAGAVIDYTIRAAAIPLRWTTLISDYDPPRRFVDVQLRGPYSFWHHEHLFEAADGGTLVIDKVHYALPGGPLGDLVHVLFVKRQLEAIFDFRREQIMAALFRAENS